MSLRCKSLFSVLIIAASMFSGSAIAQTSNNETIAETFDRAFFYNDSTYFRNRSIGRQIDFILGIGNLKRNTFLDNEIKQDAELINLLFVNTLEQQVSSDPLIRTRDLPNPYDTSILASPNLNVNSSELRNRLRLETQPSQ